LADVGQIGDRGDISEQAPELGRMGEMFPVTVTAPLLAVAPMLSSPQRPPFVPGVEPSAHV
jgi:hypothetical protein